MGGDITAPKKYLVYFVHNPQDFFEDRIEEKEQAVRIEFTESGKYMAIDGIINAINNSYKAIIFEGGDASG